MQNLLSMTQAGALHNSQATAGANVRKPHTSPFHLQRVPSATRNCEICFSICVAVSRHDCGGLICGDLALASCQSARARQTRAGGEERSMALFQLLPEGERETSRSGVRESTCRTSAHFYSGLNPSLSTADVPFFCPISLFPRTLFLLCKDVTRKCPLFSPQPLALRAFSPLGAS